MAKKEAKKRLIGIGGWLIVFILWIAYQIYGYTSNILLFTFKLPNKTLEVYEKIGLGGFSQHPVLNLILSIIPLILFIYTAILLFRKSDNFIKFGKLTIWISFIADSVLGVLLINKWGFFLIPLQLIPTAILFLYLNYSKRVANTFISNSNERAEKLKKIESTNRKKIVIWTIVISILVLLVLFVIGIVKIVSFVTNTADSIEEISEKIKYQSVNESISMCNNLSGFSAQLMKRECIKLVALYNSNKTEYRDGQLCSLIEDSDDFSYPEEDRDQCFYLTAIVVNNTALCDKVSNQDSKIICYAFVDKDENKCSALSEQFLRDSCLDAVRKAYSGENNFEIQFYLTDSKRFIDGEVLIYNKSLGLTRNGGLLVSKEELKDVETIFFKVIYNDKIVILPFALYNEDLDKKDTIDSTSDSYGITYTTSETELAADTFNITEEDIINK